MSNRTGCFRLFSQRIGVASLGFVLCWGSAAIGAEECTRDTPSFLNVQLQRAYQLSLEDAAKADPSEISQALWDISRFETREQGGKTQVLVATWTGDFYNDKVGTAIDLSRWIWVTPVPQLREFAATALDYSDATLLLRLEQYLGLPPCSRLGEAFQCSPKTKIVELWVDPKDLYRPCADPETTDTSCTTAASPTATAPPEYQAWFSATQQLSGYPWTRLGYTYDWGNPTTEVGASEFVIRSGAQVEVKAVTDTIPYLRPASP